MKNTVKKVFACLLTLSAAVLFLVKNESACAGAVYSMKLCAAAVIPSLFPFMVLSMYAVRSGIAESAGRIFDVPCRKIFRLPGEAAFIILMSLTGGFPVGAKMISSAVESGILTEKQGRRMMLFCVNAGPAFIINIVGQSILDSKKAGVILLLSTVISVLAVGFFTRFSDSEEKNIPPLKSEKNKTGALTESVESSAKSMLLICGWIIVFGAVSRIISDAPLPEKLSLWADMLCEVTNGCKTSAENFPLPVTAFTLGFSGLSVHAQIMPFAENTNLKYGTFFLFRLVNGILSAVVSAVLFHFFPCEVQVFASSSEIVPVTFSVSAYASAAAIITASLIILDLAPAKKM